MPDFLHTLKRLGYAYRNMRERTEIVIKNLDSHDGVTKGVYGLNGDIEVLRQNLEAHSIIENDLNRLHKYYEEKGGGHEHK